ncbi:MAG: ATP-dependent DNA helicase [Deltaproteobacteria bacterium]|nr:MAG: ATP-dependent DNA helicase [Deltaproteobacteria bacterium]
MAISVDFDRRRVTASVRDLVAFGRESTGAGGLSALRAQLGSRLHRAYAAERAGPAYEAEVPVSIDLDVDGFRATVRGRVDGIDRSGTVPFVEEVKTVAWMRDAMDRVTASSAPAFAAQARWYALAVARAAGGDAGARLVLLSVVDGARRTVDVPFRPERAEAELLACLRAAIAAARDERGRSRQRARWAGQVRFPYGAPRRHQRELMDAFAAALAEGRPAVAAAPTGVGKTVAALVPALRFALDRGAAVWFTTAKTTQQALVEQTFADIAAASTLPGLRAVTLRAKDRMCPPGHRLCHPDACAHLRDFDQRAGDAVDAIVTSAAHASPDAIYARGDRDTLCPFELSLRVASRADLIVADYNYVFDRPPPGDGERPRVVVIDEAHNLFDRARQYASPVVRDAALAEAIAAVRAVDGGACSPTPALRDAQAVLADARTAIADALRVAESDELEFFDGRTPIDPDRARWDALGDRAGRALLAYALYARARGGMHAGDPIADGLRSLVRLRDAWSEPAAEIVPYAARSDADGGMAVGALCVNPAGALRRHHEASAGTVAMSATLAPLDYYADVLGFAPLNPALHIAPSPFPREHRFVAIDASVSTAYRDRAGSYRRVARIIDDVCAARDGHYAAFFPSFAYLARVRPLLRTPAGRILVQLPGMAAAARARILAALRARTGPKLVLAVMGGVLSEGVDLPGDDLIGAVVVSPGLPAVGFERAVMQAYFDDRRGAGFAYAMLYPGMQRVVQAAGRVIRSERDRGVVVLVGRRFAQADYVACMPADWEPVVLCSACGAGGAADGETRCGPGGADGAPATGGHGGADAGGEATAVVCSRCSAAVATPAGVDVPVVAGSLAHHLRAFWRTAGDDAT